MTAVTIHIIYFASSAPLPPANREAKMSSDSSDFRQLMQQVDDGSNEAAQELLKRYGKYVLRAIRAHLHRDMRTEFDSEDFRQMVWKSFFADERQAMSAKEEMHRLSNGQPLYRRILEMRASGSTFDEIAAANGINEKTVRRAIKRMRNRVET